MLRAKKHLGLFVLVGIAAFLFSSVSQSLAEEGKVNINTATVKELQKLKGIGKTIAKRIVAYREDVGTFKEIADIKKVKGVGKGTLEKIADQIIVEDEKLAAVRE
ncbi:MAG: helix-hairpin-helix domain-containing protein [Proteobacteria bacterium]|nr:helix-hairpin-helix domain-containing protein [Pseudomonadota bacterium]